MNLVTEKTEKLIRDMNEARRPKPLKCFATSAN